jgi:hypothetical protein
LKYKLLVVDIDGTLVNRRGDISAEDEKALARARALGIRVVISTGRGTQSSRSIIDRLSLDDHHIFCDGALVSNPGRNDEVCAWPISQVMVKELVAAAHWQHIDLEFFSDTRYFVERETWSTEAHRQFFGVTPVMVDFDRLETRVIKGGLVATTPGEAARARDFCRQFADRLHFSFARAPAYPGIDFINILSLGVSKGKALEALASHLGISLVEAIAAGDGTNDVSLLSSVGLAIAMGNALDEVKAVADHITLDVDHSGLAAALNQFLR